MGTRRENHRNWLAAMAFALTMLWHAPAAADWTATLPLFDACSPSSAPELPARWRAVALMMPFLQGQIDVGEFVYDRDVPAMRATIYGLKSGAVDLLITEEETYVLMGASLADPVHLVGPAIACPDGAVAHERCHLRRRIATCRSTGSMVAHERIRSCPTLDREEYAIAVA
jgi:hypothetical protein